MYFAFVASVCASGMMTVDFVDQVRMCIYKHVYIHYAYVQICIYIHIYVYIYIYIHVYT